MWLLGATAGFLYSYPFAAWVAGFVSERGWGSSIVRAITGMLLALGVIYLGGWSWLAMLTDARTAFAAGVAPFVLADIVKVALGAALLPKAQALLSRI
jgi:biotin transport system substrate-specific component